MRLTRRKRESTGAAAPPPFAKGGREDWRIFPLPSFAKEGTPAGGGDFSYENIF